MFMISTCVINRLISLHSRLSSHRACFKKLPRILSFNTMRYTFNMVTMMKEKVNTHFSFPLRLDMTPYTEDFLMGKGERKEGSSEHHKTLRMRSIMEIIVAEKCLFCLHLEGKLDRNIFSNFLVWISFEFGAVFVLCCRFSGRGRVKSHRELRVRPHRSHSPHRHSRRRPLLQLH